MQECYSIEEYLVSNSIAFCNPLMYFSLERLNCKIYQLLCFGGHFFPTICFNRISILLGFNSTQIIRHDSICLLYRVIYYLYIYLLYTVFTAQELTFIVGSNPRLILKVLIIPNSQHSFLLLLCYLLTRVLKSYVNLTSKRKINSIRNQFFLNRHGTDNKLLRRENILDDFLWYKQKLWRL